MHTEDPRTGGEELSYPDYRRVICDVDPRVSEDKLMFPQWPDGDWFKVDKRGKLRPKIRVGYFGLWKDGEMVDAGQILPTHINVGPGITVQLTLWGGTQDPGK